MDWLILRGVDAFLLAPPLRLTQSMPRVVVAIVSPQRRVADNGQLSDEIVADGDSDVKKCGPRPDYQWPYPTARPSAPRELQEANGGCH